MNRKALLENSLTEDKNVASVVATTLVKDAKALKKAKRDLEDALEDAEEALQERLASSTPIDKSVVEVSYLKLKELRETILLYKEFEKEFISE
jgi:hypothetical protein